MVRDNEDVVVAVSYWQVFSLLDLEVAEASTMRKGFEFVKACLFWISLRSHMLLMWFLLWILVNKSLSYVGSIIKDYISYNVCFGSLNFLYV